MAQIQIDEDKSWFWGGAAFLRVFFVFTFHGAKARALDIRIPTNIGSSRVGTDEEAEKGGGGGHGDDSRVRDGRRSKGGSRGRRARRTCPARG